MWLCTPLRSQRWNFVCIKILLKNKGIKKKYMRSSPTLSVVTIPVRDKFLFCDSSNGFLRPLVLVQHRCQLFELLHAASHPGVSQDVGLWACSYLRCQRSKIQTHFHSSVPGIPVPTQRHMFISTLWALYLSARAALTCSPWWTG